MKTALLTATLSIAALACLPARSQQTAPLSLAQVLEKLDANLAHYDERVPSFLCDEHVVSQVESDRRKETVTDSTFRLKRTANADHTTALDESRDVKSVDGKPPSRTAARPDALQGPSMLHGIFEGGLAVVSSTQTPCMHYVLQHSRSKDGAATYVIRFSTALTTQNRAGCLLEEDSKGSVTVDTASMQIRRLEMTTPHHTIVPGDSYEPPVIGKRTLAVDYAPVLLGGETLWMPSDIAMTAVSGAATFHKTVWSFNASYRNCHKLEVTSHIHGVDEP